MALTAATRDKLRTISTATVATALFKRGFRTQFIQNVHLLSPDQPVLVTGCYQWKFGGSLPFFKIGNMADGSYLIQASATFRTEPF